MGSSLTGKRVWLVVLMFGFSLLSYFDRTIMSIAGPEIMKRFSISETAMGSVYSAFLLSYALFMIPGGYVVDRLGPRWTLTLMGAGAAVFTGLTAMGGSPGLGTVFGIVPALLAIRFLLGVFTAPLYPACGRMSANWIPPVNLGKVQGFIIGGSSLGGATSPIIFKALMDRFGWQASFGIAAAITGLLALAWHLTARDHPPTGVADVPVARKAATGRAEWKRLLGNRNLMLLTAAYGALGYYSYIFYYWIYYYFGEVRHFGFDQSARFTTLVFVIDGLMIWFGGWLSDRFTKAYGERFGRRSVPLAGLTLSAILLGVGMATASAWATVLIMAMSVGFASWCEGPFWAMTISTSGEDAGAACSILNSGSNIAGFIAPVITPWVASFAGWSSSLYLAGLVIVIGAVACAMVDPRREAPPVAAD